MANDSPETRWCEVCSEEPGDERPVAGGEERGQDTLGPYFVCASCLSCEPCAACHGEHHHAGQCAGAFVLSCPEWDGSLCTLARLIEVNAESPCGESDYAACRALAIGESCYIGPGGAGGLMVVTRESLSDTWVQVKMASGMVL